ncbi:RND family efflux transporter [Catenovulum agarivorans DS-2]|uniref:RND family efflux transporter n=1 Tax=Catenovulum agarivorans DS-2 TaxID=1328313 RepID=W7Q8G6_9ALTE|nr:efflux RND transporter permease subunit [Catenovulum agarivorans]EWH09074.1 RND family efflux transporter [Catenovulum agarivorans DS-2]
MTTQAYKRGIIAWFVNNPVAANLLMVAIVLAGIYSVFTIRKQSFPTIQLDEIHVQIPYLGAAPQEVEEGVILKVEESVKRIEGIKKIESIAQEGLARVIIDVADGYDVIEILNEVKVQVDAIASLPDNTEKPVIYRVKPEQAVLWLQVYGQISEQMMKEYANQLRDEIVQLPGISSANVVGAREYEIGIEISSERLSAYGLTLNQVVQKVRASSVKMPGGTIKSDNGDILIRTDSQAYTAADFAQIVVLQRPDGTFVSLADVADIKDGFVERAAFSNFDGQPSIGIQVNSVGNQNDLQISKTVKDYIADIEPSLPSEVKLAVWGDSSYYLNGRLELMLNNMLMGALLVFVILSVFLQLKLAVWVIVGLFVCFLGALAMMPHVGVSINMISLFAFILVLGIVVDDAIIIGESVHDTVQAHGNSVQNVVRGAHQVAVPATFGVLTTIVAFIPMLMVPGASSPIWGSIGMVVVLCLIFSLIESKWILPSHLVSHHHQSRSASQLNLLTRLRNWVNQQLNHFVQHRYAPFLAKCVDYRYTVLAVFLSLLIVTAGLVASGAVRFVFFPNLPSDYVQASITMEDGTPDVTTNKALARLESALYQVHQQHYPELEQQIIAHSSAFNTGQTTGLIWAELNRDYAGKIDGVEVANKWREAFGEMPGVRSVSFNGSIQGGAGSDLEFLFRSDNSEQIAAAAQSLKTKLQAYQGVYDIDDSYSGGKDELQLFVKPAGTALGLDLANLSSQVRAAFYGAEVQRIQRDDEEIKVMVRYPKAHRQSVQSLEQMWLELPSGKRVIFSTVAEYKMASGYSSIQRIDYQRSVSVTAKVDKSFAEPGKIAADVTDNIIPDILQQYPDVQFELFGASKEEQEAMVSLGIGFICALVAIYALMAIPLKSYMQPFIIMSVIPFGILGAVIGHILLGLSISILSFFGVIALAGVVVNDSLILVDFINRARRQGESVLNSIQQAGAKRFRAILLTSLTTFFGLIPIVSETSLQAQIVIPMAVSLAFGILFSTVITLLLLPVLYAILSDLRGVFKLTKG